jgi:hypothetical protein
MSETAPASAMPQQVLDLPLPENDSGASTVRGYLGALLAGLWREEAGFSGKRPFGNSSWQYDIYVPMIHAGMVAGQLDEDGYVERVDVPAADNLILAAIALMAEAEASHA